MATTRVSVEEYLGRVGRSELYEEYLDGEIREKTMGGGNIHGAWMVAISSYFHRHRHEWGIRALSDLHVNVRKNDYRIGDVVIVDRSVPLYSAPLGQTPIAVFEILSPTDSERETVDRLRDYEAMGTRLLFLVDPENGMFWQYCDGALAPVSHFSWPERQIQFPFAEVAQELD